MPDTATLSPAEDDLYARDFFAWTAREAARLRALAPAGLDVENLAEEIESLGRKDFDEIENRLGVLLLHLLKWACQPQSRKGGWQVTIRDQRRAIGKLIARSPSLRGHPARVLAEEYAVARLNAADETALPIETFPAMCPFPIERVLAAEWLPDGTDA